MSPVHRCAELGRRGGGPGRWELCWLAGVPEALVLAGGHGREDGVVPASRVWGWRFGCCSGDGSFLV
jgi:hypothetical protein